MSYDYKNKKCIVSGGSGFLGQGVVKKLLDEGAEVWVIDNFSYGASRKNLDKRAKLIFGDVRDEKVFKKLPSKKFDYFFHFAAPSSAVLFKKNPEGCFDITIKGFINAINYCAKRKIRLIYPSSAKVYMGRKTPFSEKDRIKKEFLDEYARAKLAEEEIAFAYKDICDSLGLRIFAGFGPSEKHKDEFASVVSLFSKDLIRGKKPVVWGDGNQARDFIYEEEITEIILTLAQKAKEPIVNVGTGKKVSYNYLIKTINNILGKKIKPKYVRSKLFLGDTQADTGLLRKYYPKFKWSFEEGVKAVVESLL